MDTLAKGAKESRSEGTVSLRLVRSEGQQGMKACARGHVHGMPFLLEGSDAHIGMSRGETALRWGHTGDVKPFSLTPAPCEQKGYGLTSCLPPDILWWSVWLHLVENSSFFTILSVHNKEGNRSVTGPRSASPVPTNPYRSPRSHRMGHRRELRAALSMHALLRGKCMCVFPGGHRNSREKGPMLLSHVRQHTCLLGWLSAKPSSESSVLLQVAKRRPGSSEESRRKQSVPTERRIPRGSQQVSLQRAAQHPHIGNAPRVGLPPCSLLGVDTGL